MTTNRENDSTNYLSWITNDKLEEIVRNRFSKALKKINNTNEQLHTDPTLIAALASFLDLNKDVANEIAGKVAIVKTLQNSIGLFHQDILGSVPGWENKGSSGGNFDIYSKDPVPLAGNKHVIAEVKMRYNTIKSSDEKNVHDMLYMSAKAQAHDTVAYIFQIVPKTPEPYDREWKPSGRTPTPKVRCADGTTAYHLVTGSESALHDLLLILPEVFRKVAEQEVDDDIDYETSTLDEYALVGIMDAAIPKHSAHATESQ